MKALFTIIILAMPLSATAQNKLQRMDAGRMERHYEYKCIQKYPELNSDYKNLRKCARSMKGKSVFTFDKEVLEEKFDFRKSGQ